MAITHNTLGGQSSGIANAFPQITPNPNTILDSYNSAMSKHDRPFGGIKESNFQIITVDNGFILVVRGPLGSVGRSLIATTVDELRDLITSELVGQAMEK